MHFAFRAFYSQPLHWYVIARIVLFTDITIHPAVDAHVGDKVTLNCTSPRDNPTSVTWHYQSSSASTVLVRIEEDGISHLDTSGRLSLNRTARNSFFLVIYGTLQSDSGTYSCSVDVGYEKQHVTVLSVRGRLYIVLLPYCRENN